MQKYDSYAGEDNEASAYNQYWPGQSITPATSFKLKRIRLLGFRQQSGIGNLSVDCKSGGCKGTILDTALFATSQFGFSGWSNRSWGSGDFLAGNQILLAGTTYYFVFHDSPTDSQSHICMKLAGVYAGGSGWWSSDSGANFGAQAWDFVFELWGEPAARPGSFAVLIG